MKLLRIIPITIVLMFIVSGIMYFLLPDVVPTHWNIEGEVDGTSPKLMAVLIMPVLSVFLGGLFVILPRIDPRRDAYTKFAKTYEQVVVSIIVFMGFIHVATLIGTWQENIVPYVVTIAVSVLLIIIGNVMGRTRSNFFFGLRTPWTLSSETVWRKSNRMTGRLFVLTGILTIIGMLIDPKVGLIIMLGMVFIAAMGGSVYSYVLYRHEIQEANAT